MSENMRKPFLLLGVAPAWIHRGPSVNFRFDAIVFRVAFWGSSLCEISGRICCMGEAGCVDGVCLFCAAVVFVVRMRASVMRVDFIIF